jgi:hypothetical protein
MMNFPDIPIAIAARAEYDLFADCYIGRRTARTLPLPPPPQKN